MYVLVSKHESKDIYRLVAIGTSATAVLAMGVGTVGQLSFHEVGPGAVRNIESHMADCWKYGIKVDVRNNP